MILNRLHSQQPPPDLLKAAGEMQTVGNSLCIAVKGCSSFLTPLALVSLGRLKPNREFYQEVSWVQQPTREEMGRHKLEAIDVSMSG